GGFTASSTSTTTGEASESTTAGTMSTSEATTTSTSTSTTAVSESESESASASTTAACADPCGDQCCACDQVCYLDGVHCVPDLGECTQYDDCKNDSFCVEQGICVPFPDGGINTFCETPREPGIFRVSVQCEWNGPPPGDP